MGSCGVCWRNEVAGAGSAYVPTRVEHAANVVTHAVAVLPALVGLDAFRELGDGLGMAYGLATLTLFTASTTYHSVSMWGRRPRLRLCLHIADRASIYAFIAASYAPFLEAAGLGGTGRLVWAAAGLGTLFQFLFHERFKLVELGLYLLIGIAPAVPIAEDTPEIRQMALGGAVFLLGVVFFKLDGRLPFAHALWHTHVLAGIAIQYSAILSFLTKHSARELPAHASTFLPHSEL